MAKTLWVPERDWNLENRIKSLGHNGVEIFPYDGEILDFFDGALKVVERLNRLCAVFPVSYSFDETSYNYVDGGSEKEVGIIHFSWGSFSNGVIFEGERELYNGVREIVERLGVPLNKLPEDFGRAYSEDFPSFYGEIRLIYKNDLTIQGLSSNYSYFILPGQKFIDDPCIQKIMGECLGNGSD